MTRSPGVDPRHGDSAESGEHARRDEPDTLSMPAAGVDAGAPRPTAPSPSGYRYEWALFDDWCIATEVDPLPASPITLAKFLGANPSSDAVQLRRVAAINRRHLDAGHAPPGRTTALRMALDPKRSERTARRAEHCWGLASALPSAGSTHALFGRRDAVLLLLSGAGLSHRAISALDRSDVIGTGTDVRIGGRHSIRIASDESTQFRPAEIWERWRTVLRFSDRFPSTTLLAEHLQANAFPDMAGWPRSAGPVAVPIDRWGHMPFPADPMTPAAVATVIGAHRSGRPPRHVPPRAPTRPPGHGEMGTKVTAPGPKSVSVVLDSDYYRIGLDARRRAHFALADMPGIADDLEDRIDHLLQRTMDLLDSTADSEPSAR